MAVNFSVTFLDKMKSLAITLIYFLAQLESRYQSIPANTPTSVFLSLSPTVLAMDISPVKGPTWKKLDNSHSRQIWSSISAVKMLTAANHSCY